MIDSVRRGEVLVLTVNGGRIDAAGSVAFKEAVRDALEGADGPVVMDLSSVSFIDSSGLGALVASAKVAGEGMLELAGAGPLVRKVLTLTHMDRVFPLHDDLEAALLARSTA